MMSFERLTTCWIYSILLNFINWTFIIANLISCLLLFVDQMMTIERPTTGWIYYITENFINCIFITDNFDLLFTSLDEAERSMTWWIIPLVYWIFFISCYEVMCFVFRSLFYLFQFPSRGEIPSSLLLMEHGSKMLNQNNLNSTFK